MDSGIIISQVVVPPIPAVDPSRMPELFRLALDCLAGCAPEP